MFGALLSGQEQPRHRFRGCLAAVEGAMGELVGKSYSDVAFHQEDKTAAESLIQQIEKTFVEILSGKQWLTNTTRGDPLRQAVAHQHYA